MKLIFCLCSLLMIFPVEGYSLSGASGFLFSTKEENIQSHTLTAMEALDLVKERYAVNFEKVYPELQEESPDAGAAADKYYYKLPLADYYLVYEGQQKSENEYIIHLYEYIPDEPDLNLGHAVTYGWYAVDKETGQIKDFSY